MPNANTIKIRKVITALLMVCLASSVFHLDLWAQTLRDLKNQNQPLLPLPKKRIAPDLEDALEEHDKRKAVAANEKTLAQVRRDKGTGKDSLAATWSSAAQSAAKNSAPHNNMQRVVVHLSGAATDLTVKSCALKLGGQLKEIHRNLQLATLEVPLDRVRELAVESDVDYVSPDRPLTALGHIETTTGAEQARKLVTSLTNLDGTGVGIAVIDSGVDSSHKLLRASPNHPGVIASTDFIGVNAAADHYGHGSFVASIAAGSSELSNGVYEGIAPSANIINLKVLDDTGNGFTSSVIAALDWCLYNKTRYNIRVINLSLGAPAKDSYRNDPLCLAARRAYAAGIVVVVAAGNEGKDALGNKIYGGIQSPGIDPSVITVGATNTFFTDRRGDDRVATYSSRGPTRGYASDASGVKRYDNLLKPDLVAPGNRVIGASSKNAADKNNLNNLVLTYPSLAINPTSKIEDRVMYLSGTSVSAPIVAGAAALLLEANPSLTPNLVKAILMYTAQPLLGHSTLEQGMGMVNIDGAVRVAKLIKSNASSLPNGYYMLVSPLPSSQASSIAGETCWWGQGVITNYCFLYGSNLMTYWQGMYGNNFVLADATKVVSGVIKQIAGFTSSGIYNSAGATVAYGGTASDGILVASGVVFADGIAYPSGVVFADGRLTSDPILLTDKVKAKVIFPGD